jgi:hypothetical protein
LTGGIRKGAKGDPPVAHFHSITAHYSPIAARALRSFRATQCGGFSNFFLFIHTFFGIRHSPGGNLSGRLVNESCSLSLFSRGSFRQHQAISFQAPARLCLERPRVFVLAKQLHQRTRHSQ